VRVKDLPGDKGRTGDAQPWERSTEPHAKTGSLFENKRLGKKPLKGGFYELYKNIVRRGRKKRRRRKFHERNERENLTARPKRGKKPNSPGK